MDLTLPWPPSVNRIWRGWKGRIILSAEARKFKRAAAAALPAGRTPKPLEGRLLVWITLCAPLKLARGGQRWDIANREKLLCDVLTAQRVWHDDSQIDAMVILRGQPSGTGSAHVAIRVLDGPLDW